ncbi:GIN domain-containing protein [Sphingobium subterraneum]|uniref:Putative auto-transporter adhesin head GIN domain-containing protein n=1 Tax=Sphingobium subterraneum TaxID=627688 RepID=A0A841J0W3_9SPHN|nr:DUF2807 domain-containing protein [Sphingobium subterraneum]MBB6123982.1 hypothetical protein [Sphingobium subterraneum]
MIRKLLIVSASGIGLAIVALGGAWAIGGDDVAKRIGSRSHIDWMMDWRDDDDYGPQTSRTVSFDGATPLTIDVPVTLDYRRGMESRMVISGSDRALKALRWADGRLSLDKMERHHSGIRVTIVAPRLTGLSLQAPGAVRLRDMQQPEFRLNVDGPTDVEAAGTVGKLEVIANGVGNIDLEDVQAKDATVKINGVGNVEISAAGTVDADMAGIGNLSLHQKPGKLNSRAVGIGSIDHDY